MGIESASYVNELINTNPTGSDPKSTSDDHHRLIKTVLLNSFPNIGGPVTATHTDLSKVGVTQAQTSNDTSSASTAFVQTAVAAAISAIGSGASLWVSGTTYALGNVAWSPTNYQTYRRIVAGAGATDPASDATNWVLVTGNVQTTATQTLTNKTLTAPVITGGVTVSSGGASITGNTSVTGTLSASGIISASGNSYSVGDGNALFGKYSGDGYIQMPSGGTLQIWKSTTDVVATFSSTGDLLPGANGTQAFGSTSLRWSQVWCTAGAFNTSDAALKTPIRSMQSAELDAGYQMAQELGTFQWLESIKEKGDKARRHVGLTVQRAAEILEAHGLDAWSYGFMGYDKWPAVTEIADATEEDEGAYQEKVTQQKTVKQTSQTQTVEVINGKPTLKVETVESDVPVTEQIQVIDAEGKLVFTTVAEVPAVFDDEGNEVSPAVPAHMVPMMHAVPVMETVTVWKRVKEVRPAGESYAFRSDQLAFFIAAGVAAKVGA